jgi:hypothetical protein
MAQLEVTLTCPACGHASLEIMPTDRCVAFHECGGCHALITPKPGDCCVFCSYADTRCPFVQDDTACPGPAPLPRSG